MRFEERELKDYAEPVSAAQLEEGTVVLLGPVSGRRNVDPNR
jgi:hypothetical protein